MKLFSYFYKNYKELLLKFDSVSFTAMYLVEYLIQNFPQMLS